MSLEEHDGENDSTKSNFHFWEQAYCSFEIQRTEEMNIYNEPCIKVEQ